MKWLKSHWPAIASVGAGLLTVVLPSLQAYVAAHPKSTVSALLAAAIAAYYANSPKQQKELTDK